MKTYRCTHLVMAKRWMPEDGSAHPSGAKAGDWLLRFNDRVAGVCADDSFRREWAPTDNPGEYRSTLRVQAERWLPEPALTLGDLCETCGHPLTMHKVVLDRPQICPGNWVLYIEDSVGQSPDEKFRKDFEEEV